MTRGSTLYKPNSYTLRHWEETKLLGDTEKRLQQVHGLSQALDRAERESTKLQEDVLSLRAEGERLRIELDSSAARVRQLEEEKGAREAARVAEIENEVLSLYHRNGGTFIQRTIGLVRFLIYFLVLSLCWSSFLALLSHQLRTKSGRNALFFIFIASKNGTEIKGAAKSESPSLAPPEHYLRLLWLAAIRLRGASNASLGGTSNLQFIPITLGCTGNVP